MGSSHSFSVFVALAVQGGVYPHRGLPSMGPIDRSRHLLGSLIQSRCYHRLTLEPCGTLDPEKRSLLRESSDLSSS